MACSEAPAGAVKLLAFGGIASLFDPNSPTASRVHLFSDVGQPAAVTRATRQQPFQHVFHVDPDAEVMLPCSWAITSGTLPGRHPVLHQPVHFTFGDIASAPAGLEGQTNPMNLLSRYDLAPPTWQTPTRRFDRPPTRRE